MQRQGAAVGGDGILGAQLEQLPRQFDLPATGRTFRCCECSARLREGEPHVAREPRPHGTLELLTVRGS